ncbi:hypothetical protein D3C72_1472560 [compost metagenome]
MQVAQDAGVARVEAVEPRHQPFRGKGGQRGQMEGASAGAMRNRLQRGAADALQRGRQLLLVAHAGFSQQDAPLLAPEQRNLQQVLQRLHLPADGALGQRQFGRGPREAQVARAGLEGQQQGHGGGQAARVHSINT